MRIIREHDINSWRRLYELAGSIKELAPWGYMEETDVFGIRIPGQHETIYASVMGTLGEHHAVSAYIGDDSIARFWNIQCMDYPQSYVGDLMLEMRQLMLSFEDRNNLEKKDRDLLKSLGLKYHGHSSWPKLRSYSPGLYPWYLEPEEVDVMITVLEQVMDVAQRIKSGACCLPKEDDECLFRVSSGSPGRVMWQDSISKYPQPEPINMRLSVSAELVSGIKSLGRGPALDIDFFVMPGGVKGPAGRPAFLYMLLAVEPESGMIAGYEMLQALNGLAGMWEELPARLAQIFLKANQLPVKVRTCSPRLYEFTRRFLDDSGVEMIFERSLDAIDDAKESLLQHMS